MCRLPTRLPNQSRRESSPQLQPFLLSPLPSLQQADLQWDLPPDQRPFPQQSQDTNDSIDNELLLLLSADTGESEFAGAQPAYVTGADAVATQPDKHGQQVAYAPHATQPCAMFPSSAAVGSVLHDGRGAPCGVGGVVAMPLPTTATAGLEDIKPADAAAILDDYKPPASAPRSRRRTKTQQEIQAQMDRVKKRRRESAQRSRQRKNVYVNQLEDEVEALRVENARLRSMVGLPPDHHTPVSSMSHASMGPSMYAAAPGMDALFDLRL